MDCVVSSPIIVGGVRCFFYNYCWWSALFPHQLLYVECVVSSLIIIVGGRALFLLQLLLVECVFFFNYHWWSAMFLL